jgi:hypothetical protein
MNLLPTAEQMAVFLGLDPQAVALDADAEELVDADTRELGPP